MLNPQYKNSIALTYTSRGDGCEFYSTSFFVEGKAMKQAHSILITNKIGCYFNVNVALLCGLNQKDLAKAY